MSTDKQAIDGAKIDGKESAAVEVIDWWSALRQVGKALFGKDYIERLTHHEHLLLEEYDLLGVDERSLAAFIDPPMPGNVPTDNPAYSLVVRAAMQLRYMRWMDRHAERWIEEHNLLSTADPFQITADPF